jgi:hypothetical protein
MPETPIGVICLPAFEGVAGCWRPCVETGNMNPLLRRLLLVVCLCLVLGWAAYRWYYESFPRVPVGNITTFSLGSERFTPFRSRPTAKLLFDKTSKLYGSFQTVASSSRTDIVDYDYGEGNVRNSMVETSENETRWASPDRFVGTRSLISSRETMGRQTIIAARQSGRGVIVSDGRASLRLAFLRRIYDRRPAQQSWYTNPARFIYQDDGTLQRFHTLRLLPDSRVNGCAVYVLELRGLLGDTSPTLDDSVLVRSYLGKKDLLPRRIDRITGRKVKGRMDFDKPGSLETHIFSGFVVNSALSPKLFDTRPPRGYKSSEESIAELRRLQKK